MKWDSFQNRNEYTVTSYDLDHAIRYAQEATQLYIYEQALQSRYAFIFKHTTFQIRKADSKRDYYIPKTLDPEQCHVVEKFVFTQTGCDMIACFPFQENLESCSPEDEPRWIRLGTGFSLACQPACDRLYSNTQQSMDTEYRNGKCVAVNLAKKLLALLPEQVFFQSNHPSLPRHHAGLNLVEGHLRLNQPYCEAYGLVFNGSDCVTTTGQDIGEFFLGSSIYRSISTLQKNHTLPPYPPHLPDFVQNWPKKHVKRSLVHELAIDVGIDIGLEAAQKILEKRMPKLLTKLSMQSLPIQSAILQAVVRTQLSTLATLSRIAATGFSVTSNVLTGISILSAVLDILDPFHFNKVLTARTLYDIDWRLDVQFYQSETDHVLEITPDLLWDVLEEDASDRYLFFAEKVQEYLDAIHKVPMTDRPQTRMSFLQKSRTDERTPKNWIYFTIIVYLLTGFTFLFQPYMHYLCVTIFFLFVFYFYRHSK